jgi:DNA-binding beta-propeller fold protein YncE
LAGSFNTPGYARGVTVSGNYAYVADGSSGLQIINISNPASPILAGSFNTPGYARGVTVSGNYAYVADGFSRIPVLDISDPSNITLVGTYYTKGESRQLVIDNGFLYSADGWAGLSIIDLDDMGIENNNSPVISKNIFLQNYPNPFNLVTEINFNINTGHPKEMDIFDIRGKRVESFRNIKTDKITWNTENKNLVSGFYLAKLKAGEKTYTKKMLMVK